MTAFAAKTSSMSGYGKNQEQYVYDAAATRPNQAPSYPGLAQPSFASQYTETSARLPHEHSSVEVPYIPASTYESRGDNTYRASSSFIDARSRHSVSHLDIDPVVTNAVNPSQGTAGSTILLHIRTKFDIANTPDAPVFAFMFGEKRCEAAIQKVDDVDDYYHYALSAQVPPFKMVNSWNPTLMLKLRMEDKNADILGEIDAGKFTFTDMSPGLTYQSVAEPTKKRKYSTEFDEAEDYATNTAKRPSTTRLQAKPRSMSAAYTAASLSPLPANPSLSTAYALPGGYDLQRPSYTPQLSQKGLYAVPTGMSMQQTDMKPPHASPGMSSYSQYGPISHRSPASIAATPYGATKMPSPSAVQAPVLVRATTLPQGASGSGSQPFNPYGMYPSKAVLKIEGDLNSMTENWTREEFEAKRRLVQFERSQNGSTINTTFAPITPEARPARSICVSCILWEEKDECFITSVDTIFLLEQLVNVRFTVEEKNRIRRNLEGFRPLTVSKAKPDSEEFFKVIMGFPNPKPRNIEKDVKVFPWKILSHALKKIIGKYTASYSSTAGIGVPPSASTSYLPVGISQAADMHRNTSPRSVASSTASTVYTPNLTSTSVSPNLRSSVSLDGSAGHGMSVSQRDPTRNSMSQWVTTHQQVSQYAGTLPGARDLSWGDYQTFLDTSSATAAGVSSAAQSMHMQRSGVTPDLNQIPSEGSYQQYGQRTSRV